jgi:uncharacterized protein involved in cysteine biosynthesis
VAQFGTKVWYTTTKLDGVPFQMTVIVRRTKAVVLVLLMGGIYDVRCSDCFMWHEKLTKFHDDWFRHLSNVMVIFATI